MKIQRFCTKTKLKNKDLQSDFLKKLVELMPGIIWKKKENSF